MNKRFLKAAEGRLLTNGSICADCVFLSREDTAGNWREVTQQEAALLQEAQEQDYLASLAQFGVIV